VIAEDLAALRQELTTSAGRAFAAAAGDVLAAWPVLLGCAAGALLLACVYALLALYAPGLAYAVVSLLGTIGLAATAAVFWARGDERLASADAAVAELDALRISAEHERNAGITLTVVAVLHAMFSVTFFFLIRPSLALFEPASRVLRMATLWPLAPSLSLLLLAGFLVFWFSGLALVASSSEIEVGEDGWGPLAYNSSTKDAIVLFALGGLWVLSLIAHVGQLAAASQIGPAYWRPAEIEASKNGPALRQPAWLLLTVPAKSLGSAVLGCTICPFTNWIVFWLRLFGIESILPIDETAYIAVATFGASFIEGCRAARLAAARLLPHVAAMQGRCGAVLFSAKLSVALLCAGVAALVLHFDPAFAPGNSSDGRSISSLPLPVFFVFGLAYLIGAAIIAPIELAIAAAVHSWVLDYDQNVEAYGLTADDTFMMAAEAKGLNEHLRDIHGFMLDEFDAAEDRREARAEAQTNAAKSRVQIRSAHGARRPKTSGAVATSLNSQTSNGRRPGGGRARATLDQSGEESDGEGDYQTSLSPPTDEQPVARRRRPGTVVPGHD